MEPFSQASARVMRNGGAMIMFMAIIKGGNYNTALQSMASITRTTENMA